MAGQGRVTEFISEEAYAQLSKAEKGLLDILNAVNRLNNANKSATLPSQFAGNNTQAIASLKAIDSERKKSIATVERQRLSEIKLQQAREKAFIKYDAQLKKEQATIAKSENLYNKIQAKVNGLTATYNNLAAKQAIGLRLNDREQAQLSSLEKRLLMYNNALKRVDATIGKSQRNVGNYASGFNPLNNAIGQISRELPNFGQSFSVGVLSLTNNIGALQDAIAGVVAQNKILIEQGKPTQSVFKAIMSSILTFNTALFIGIGLFSAYSDEIGDFVSNLFKGRDAIDAAKESATALNTIRLDSAKAIVQERVELNNNLATAADTTKSYTEREIAAKKVLDQYPFYFEALGKEAIMNGKVEQATLAVNAALLARAKSEAAVTKITANQSKIIDLEEELRLQKEIEDQEALRVFNAQKQATRSVGRSTRESSDLYQTSNLTAATTALNASKREQAEIQKQINALNDHNNTLLGYSLNEYKNSIGLDYQKEASTMAASEALRDFIANQYELIKLRLENEAKLNEEIFKSDEVNYERREQAAQEYYKIQTQLAENRLRESLRVQELEANTEIASIQKRIRDKEITEKNGNDVIFSIRKQLEFDSLKSYEEFAEDLRNVDRGIAESMKGVWNEINFNKAQNLIDERDVRANQEYAASLQDIVDKNKDYREIQEANREFQIASRGITRANIQAEIDRIEVEMLDLKDTEANVKRRLELQNQLLDKQKELTQVTVTEAQEQAAAMEKLQKATEAYLNSFSSNALSEFGFNSLNTFLQIEENGKTMFENLIDGANTAAEQFAVAFNAIGQVAKDVAAFMTADQEAYFRAEEYNLQRSYEINKMFAGENAAAQLELEKQLEEQRRDIRMRELKAQKEQAIFNAIINTAQGVTSALASANIPLSVVVGALGLIQVAAIQAREIPAFKDGVTNFGGGMAIVGDGGRPEVVRTPDGGLFRTPAKDTLVNLPKGSDVFKSEADFLRKSGTLLGGVPDISKEVIVDWDKMDGIMAKYLSGTRSFNMNFDRKGFGQYLQDGYVKKLNFNNRTSVSGRTIT